MRNVDHLLELAEQQNRNDLAAIVAAVPKRLIGVIRASAADLAKMERDLDRLGITDEAWGQF